jgi:hypothetical protein
MRGNNDDHGKKNFTTMDDALIRQQPVTAIGLKRLAQLLRTTEETIRNRATELGVSLVIGEGDEAIDTRAIRCTDDEYVDPLLERLKDVYGK